MREREKNSFKKVIRKTREESDCALLTWELTLT